LWFAVKSPERDLGFSLKKRLAAAEAVVVSLQRNASSCWVFKPSSSKVFRPFKNTPLGDNLDDSPFRVFHPLGYLRLLVVPNHSNVYLD
jgi:hypothetical protein